MILGIEVDYGDNLFDVISQDRNVEGYAVVQIAEFMGDSGHKNAKRVCLLGVGEIISGQLHSCVPITYVETLMLSSI